MNVHVSVLQEEEIKIGLESEIIQVETPGDYIPVPSTAEVGQTIVVKSVDENGKPTAWEAVDAADAEEIGTRLSSLADENANLKKDLSNLAPVGAAVGQLFRVAAISEDGKYTMEPVDMLDVKINGESIVQDGVANIPIITGDNNQFGLIRIATNYHGINVNSNGQISIADASKSHIDGRNSNRAIVPTNYDYAVKAAMCDGKGAAWTADEQAAARERIGIPGNYELIHDETITEDIYQYTIDNISLKKAIIVFYSVPYTSDNYLLVDITLDASVKKSCATIKAINKNGYVTYYYAYCEEVVFYNLSAGPVRPNGATTNYLNKYVNFCFAETITAINPKAYTSSAVIPAGCRIIVYGVRT